MTRKTFETHEPLSLVVRVAAGELLVDAVETNETEVEIDPLDDAAEELLDSVRVELRGRDLTVEVPEKRGFFGRNPRFAIRMRVPRGSRLAGRMRSAEVEARGVLGDVDLKTASGDVTLEEVERDVRVQSASGDITVERAGSTAVTTASGDLVVGRVLGTLKANLVSGDILVRRADGPVETHTVSGDQRLETVGPASVSAQSVSGDVVVAVRRGATVWLDVRSISGDTQSELEHGEGPPADPNTVMELRVNTVSGDVRIERATAEVAPGE
jgi:DUF4097 and DUF4098 domain-containing protein YvlB